VCSGLPVLFGFGVGSSKAYEGIQEKLTEVFSCLSSASHLIFRHVADVQPVVFGDGDVV
jgi:hypothetical protein